MCKKVRAIGISFSAALANTEILCTKFDSGFKTNVKILKHGIYWNINSVFNEAVFLGLPRYSVSTSGNSMLLVNFHSNLFPLFP